MFSIPLISSVPIPGLFGGTVIVPGLGAFFAVVLIAALVGSGLGMLRQLTSPHPDSATRHPALIPPAIDHNDHHVHQEAA